MIEDKDYIMRLTHEIVRTLIKLFFNRDIDKENEIPASLERLEQFKKLTAMIDSGQINEAENQLLDELEPDSLSYFEMALLFYEKLGCKSEQFLEEHGFTQDEIVDGLRYIVNYYGYGDLWDPVSR